MKTLTGIVHGNTIELSTHPGLPDGEEVEIQVVAVKKHTRSNGEGLRRCAGALADTWTEEDDRILREIDSDRQSATYRELPE